jgi:hypothetical protein
MDLEPDYGSQWSFGASDQHHQRHGASTDTKAQATQSQGLRYRPSFNVRAPLLVHERPLQILGAKNEWSFNRKFSEKDPFMVSMAPGSGGKGISLPTGETYLVETQGMHPTHREIAQQAGHNLGYGEFEPFLWHADENGLNVQTQHWAPDKAESAFQHIRQGLLNWYGEDANHEAPGAMRFGATGPITPGGCYSLWRQCKLVDP